MTEIQKRIEKAICDLEPRATVHWDAQTGAGSLRFRVTIGDLALIQSSGHEEVTNVESWDDEHLVKWIVALSDGGLRPRE